MTKGEIRQVYVHLKDLVSTERFAKRVEYHEDMPYSIALKQPFTPSATLESKMHNLEEAAARINAVTIMPGETFSFWKIVGNPQNKRRFKCGRTIEAGKVHLTTGGGLCQASGIIHHMALLTGLKVSERFNHSVDLYTEESRFAPLGTDATVYYGFKDLRIVNVLPQPIRFELTVRRDSLLLCLRSTAPLLQHDLAFVRKDESDSRQVEIYRDNEIVCRSRYRVDNSH